MDIRNKIHEYMNEYIKLWPFSGIVTVVKSGEVIFNENYGMANIEHSVPMTEKTKFRISSLTKAITCMGIMILKERGMLDTSDDIRTIFHDYPELDEGITIHHLMTHTSGLSSNFSVADPYLMLGKRLCTHEEVFDTFKDMPLEFEPGKGWSYCYFGYYLLGVIIERVSGQSFREFIKENIFKPLEMKDSGLDEYIEILPNKASGYYASDENLICCDIDTKSTFSAGAIYSTAEDMLLWDKALYTEKLVSKKTMDEIFTPYKYNYGYGWIIDRNFNRKRARHSGGGSWGNGYNHQFQRYIDDEITILVLSNYGFSSSFNINENIGKIIFNEEYSMPSRPEAFELDLNIYDSYTGVYEENGAKIEVKRDKENLYFVKEFAKQGCKWKMPIYPISENKFHHMWIDQEYSIGKDDSGELRFNGIKKIS
ncbi:serine hydrolase domain-containing protein [Dethiothermospora halolimnae]|uniref:serine hydrolase domain-containing protein n=1 Tax=Dethiothermospora halolimnae TaxID=3114390 RepID=UPI003CCBCD7D